MANFSIEWLSKSFYDEVKETASAKSAPEEPTKEPGSQSLPASPNSDSDFSSESEDELNDCVEGASPHLGRKRKTQFTPTQLYVLENMFTMHKYVTAPQRRKICEEAKLTDVQVKTWFQNRRTRFKRAMRNGQLRRPGRRPGRRPRPALLLPRISIQHPTLSGQLLPVEGFLSIPQPLFSPVLSFAPADNDNTPLNLSLHGPH